MGKHMYIQSGRMPCPPERGGEFWQTGHSLLVLACVFCVLGITARQQGIRYQRNVRARRCGSQEINRALCS